MKRTRAMVAQIALFILALSVCGFADVLRAEVVLGPNVPQPGRAVGNWTKWNAAGLDLRGSKFVGVDLSKSNFDNCDLDGVRFEQYKMSRCSFRNANFRGAELIEVNFDAADFSGARINGIKRRDRTGVLCLTDKQIKATWSYRKRDLSDCVILRYQFTDPRNARPRLDFSGFDLSNAVFEIGDFSMCEFRDAEIVNVLFYQAKVEVEQLESTRTLGRKSLFGVRFSRDELDGKLSLVSGDIRNCRLYIHPDADVRDARLDVAELHRLTFEQLKTTASFKANPECCIHQKRFFGGRLPRHESDRVSVPELRFLGCQVRRCRDLRCGNRIQDKGLDEGTGTQHVERQTQSNERYGIAESSVIKHV